MFFAMCVCVCVCVCRIDLELFDAADVMSPAMTIQRQQSANLLARLLLNTVHSGFPVILVNQKTGDEYYYGLINR